MPPASSSRQLPFLASTRRDFTVPIGSMDSFGQIGISSLLDSFPKNRKNFRTVVLRGHMPHKLHTIVSGGVTVARELRVTHGPYRVWAFFAEGGEKER